MLRDGRDGRCFQKKLEMALGPRAPPPARPKPVGGEVLQNDRFQASQLTCLTSIES